MNPDAETIRQALACRLSLEALYICGPFDAAGEPASPDIHVLALSSDDEVRDFHYVPGVSSLARRVEVSVVPARLIKTAWERGVADWLTFYTFDKMKSGKPITESPYFALVRELLAANLRMRPSFYSAMVRNVSEAIRSLEQEGQDALGAVMRASAFLVSVMSLYTVARKKTFTKLSELIALQQCQTHAAQWRATPESVSVAVSSAACFIRWVVARFDIEAERVAVADRQEPS